MMVYDPGDHIDSMRTSSMMMIVMTNDQVCCHHVVNMSADDEI